MSQILYIEKIPAGERAIFSAGLVGIARLLNVSNLNWLMQVMYAESKVNPKAYNATSGASGLIQFMPATAKGLGTTTQLLLRMTATQQLEYVYKYFRPYRGRLNSYFDVYMVVFFPVAIGKPENWVFQTARLSPEIIAKQNPAINIIKDGKITISEFKQYLQKTVPKIYQNIIFPVAAGGAALLLFSALFFF